MYAFLLSGNGRPWCWGPVDTPAPDQFPATHNVVVLWGDGERMCTEWARSARGPAERTLAGVLADWVEDNMDGITNREWAAKLVSYMRNRFNRV